MKLKWLLFLPLFIFADVKKELINFYRQYYPTIEIVSIYTQKPFPKRYKKISFKLINPKYPSGNLIIDNHYYFFKINAKIKVFIATKIIKKNESISQNVKPQIIPFRSFYSKPLTDISPNLIASRIIAKNQIITKNNTKIRPEILKNDPVSVIFKGDAIEIYSKGKALNDANENEKVKVKIKNKIYEGFVKKGEVVIKWKF